MRPVCLTVSVFALTLGMSGGAHAQATYPSPYAAVPSPYTVQPLSDADQLATEIRLLAVDPKNLQALVRAGELALKLDDDTAAAAFFARAERIDPRNARVKAGEGSLLVSAERPGEALRHFAEAAQLGGDPRSFAADRGLAYDLVGEQDRAQRDYRVALRAAPNDETQRRYALSLGISGKRDLALTQIDLLLRKSDRGAWRARAFILAMGGDKAGAEKIATSMMPAGTAQGLQPFFEILPGLRPADRAFAVHFGEVRSSPERTLDARLVPPLATLGPDPTAPVEPAAAKKPVVVVVDAREQRRREREARKARGRVEVAALTTPPPQPLPAPPVYAAQVLAPTYAPVPSYVRPSSGSRAVIAANAAQLATPRGDVARPAAVAPVTFVQRVPTPTPLPTSLSPAPRQPVVLASAAIPQRVTATPSAIPSSTVAAANVARATPDGATAARVPALAAATPTATSVSRPEIVTAPRTTAPASPSLSSTGGSTPVTALPAATLAAAAETSPVVSAVAPPVVAVAAAPSGGRAATPSSTTFTAPTVAAPTVAAVPTITPTPVRSEDSILASIISDIKVPGSELPIAAAPASTAPVSLTPAEPVPDDSAAIAARAETARAAAEHLAEEKRAAKEAADQKAADKKLADKKAATDKKALADKKAAADKKIADAKKLADAKAAEEKRKHDPKLLEPARIWVQVAGGANEGDLPKQWAKLRSANAKQFAGRSGWTTPLRATNRILTGPFASDDEAQTFVNKIAKDGLSGFVFTSEAGQKITKLGAK